MRQGAAGEVRGEPAKAGSGGSSSSGAGQGAGPAGQTGGGMPVEGGSSGGGSGSTALAARHPKQKRKAHSLSIRRTNSTEERQPLGILRGDMLEGQVSLG